MTELSIEQEYKNYENENTTPALVKNQNKSGKSLCSGCPNEWGDKELCSEHCLRLRAFQYNKPFQALPYYAKSQTSPQIVDPLPETPKTAKPITQETTPWKKAMPVKPKKKPISTPVLAPIPTKDDTGKPVNLTVEKVAQKPKIPSKSVELTHEEKLKIIKETTVCLNCGRDASKYKLRRGLCVTRCSGAWRENRITHPLFGVWKPMTQGEVNEARYGKHKECLMPDCHEVGDRRGLCRIHYRAWIGGSIDHPDLGKWLPKEKKKEGKPMSEDPAKYKVTRKSTEKDGITSEILNKLADDALQEAIAEEAISHSVSLDFTHYQEIYGELKKQMESSKLPLGHVIMNVLSLGIMSAHEEEKRREKGV